LNTDCMTGTQVLHNGRSGWEYSDGGGPAARVEPEGLAR